ncbi:prolyl oligopeptidase [Coprinopsis marcescibilis]|uniref:Prolyl endopeptidase n=1 Tax=Coprinopsis marcescibilis TaxID=230819 RepID=A0A5C3KQR3_COPMA|nr:prolyl oligopeptidase [Coprinopsis marcescibilis]
MSPWVPNKYPETRRGDHVDIYKSTKDYEVKVPDPYRWLEGASEEINEWTSAQDDYTRKYIDDYPHRQELEDAFLANYDYAKFSAPYLADKKRWYWWYNSGLQAQSVYYRSKDGQLPDRSDGANNGDIFFDVNALTEDGTASISVHGFSESGEYYAYGISYSGSDFTTIYVRRVDSPFTSKEQLTNDPGRLQDELKFVKFSSITWTPDSNGFFYQRYPEPESGAPGIKTGRDTNAKLYYHRINTAQSEDILVYYDESKPEYMYGIQVTDDDQYVVLYISQDTSKRNLLWIAPLEQESIDASFTWNKMVNEFEAGYRYVSNDGPIFVLKTNTGAPKYQVVTIDTSKDNILQTFIPESDATLMSISPVNKGQNFVVVYSRNVKDEVYIYSKEGTEISRLVPDFIGSISVITDFKDSYFFVTLSGFTTPGTYGRYDFTAPEEQRWSIYSTTKVPGLILDEFESQQEWYQSKDGTKVPMFIVRHKSTPLNGTAAALQYGYGGFNNSITPSFGPVTLTFLKIYPIIYVVCNIRGGGEFGKEWHEAGYRENKHNCFDDFIAGTEFLIRNNFAAPGKVAIQGGSNGGLLVSACVNRAPEGTFGVALADVGVHDLLRFHRFTIGKAWTSDYGDPDNPDDFDFIYPISPLHNVSSTKVLPPMLLYTADHDDRVVPSHSFKLAATLQHLRADNPSPILLRVNKKTGHGAGKSTKKRIQDSADKLSFVAQVLHLKWRVESN